MTVKELEHRQARSYMLLSIAICSGCKAVFVEVGDDNLGVLDQIVLPDELLDLPVSLTELSPADR